MESNDSVYGGKTSLSQNDKRAPKIMQDTAALQDGHYTIALPWKDDAPCLENNRSPVVEHRLRLLKKRLLKDSDLRVKYAACIKDLPQKEYAKTPRYFRRSLLPSPSCCFLPSQAASFSTVPLNIVEVL